MILPKLSCCFTYFKADFLLIFVFNFGEKLMACNCSEAKNSVEILSKLLANTYVLLVKTHNVHWNVKGSQFGSIHSLTETHYNELFNAIDEIAERIRKIGHDAPATMSEFLKLSCVSEELNATSQTDMLKALLADHETIVSGLKKGIATLSSSDDYGTVDLLTSRLASHEKTVWLLKSTLA